MINVEHVSVTFNTIAVLQDVSLSVPKGIMYVVLGKNGSGKTVLLKTIAGLYLHFTGTIAIAGIPLKQYVTLTIEEKINRNITMAYVFQKGGLFDSMNVFDNVAFGLRRRKEDEAIVTEKVMAALEWVGLRGSEQKLPSELSGGMQKRVGLARALCLSPSIILYDDPTAGLDPVLADSISDLIVATHNKFKMTSIMVTQDLAVAQKVAHRIGLLHNGTIVVDLKNEEFFSRSNPYAKQFIDGDSEGPIDTI
ncbi:MAG: ATP-binding cassette domain-containing protein [Spirochaetes bacterium]|nr:ATP-binding cassette domain-containing protein [Spirochaetota bacterium]